MKRTTLATVLSLAALAFVAAPLAYAGPQPTPPMNTESYNVANGFGAGGGASFQPNMYDDGQIGPTFQALGQFHGSQLGSMYITAGYPCMWSAMHDLKQGNAAYRRGDYAGSVAAWQAAASKTCPLAAYKLSLMYLQGRHVPVNHALGTAWMAVAANSHDTLLAYGQVHNILMEKLGAADQAQAHADYASLRTSLNLPVPAPAAALGTGASEP